MISAAPLSQIAYTVLDVKKHRRWYQDVFDLVPARQTNLFFGPLTTRVQGIPRVAERCWWLVDSEDFFQLELFQFWSPRSKPQDPERRMCDLGYNMVGLHVVDFNGVLERLSRVGAHSLTGPAGPEGQRRVCLRDPEGVFLEIMEADPLSGKALPKVRPDIPTTIRSITLSVPDLAPARKTFMETFLLPEAEGEPLHKPDHERLWGLEGAQRRSLVLDAGRVLIELVEYIEPKGKPKPPDYRICDQGLMNIAFGAQNRTHFAALFKRAVAGGCQPNGKPLEVGVMKVMYLNDAQNSSIELLYVEPLAYGLLGFRPALQYMTAETFISAPATVVWSHLTNHDQFGTWLPFQGNVLRPGRSEPNGAGSLRRLSGLGLNLEEEILSWQPPKWYSYRLIKGAPLKDHFGHVQLRQEGDLTKVTWTIRFAPRIPGTGFINRVFLKGLFTAALHKLKQKIEAKA
ncbi:SRPBCC family protein [candidate division CSSED10-310 bacterium]|uniref:SRPBCC family protein n=1 Tax=candidate division CSSED10-310 bacterium TaxID=2855610 RepID=A0ABV6YWJ2_UNCC1